MASKLFASHPFLPIWTRGTLAALGCVLWTGLAQAGTWIWQDDSGRKVYSDLPPPSSVPDKRILQQPGRPKMSVEAQAPTTALTPALPPKAATKPPQDPAAVKKQRETEQAAESERQAQEQKNALARAENCRRAQSSLGTLQSGVRMVTTNEQGQQVVYDDAMRAAEASRLQAIIQDSCY